MTDAPAPMNPADDPDRGEVTIVRELAASPAVIFRAFFDPDQLSNFWGPVGMTTPADRIVIEPVPGGRFETVMVNDATGEEYPTGGRFVAIDEPTSWSFEEPDIGMVTATTLEDLGDGRTRMTIHQTNVPSMFRSPEARAGFETAIDKAEAYFASLS